MATSSRGRARDYPTPPLKPTVASLKFEQAAAELGYHPFRQPASNLSQPYTNSYGIEKNPGPLVSAVSGLP